MLADALSSVYLQNFLLKCVNISNFSALYISPFQTIVSLPFDKQTEQECPITAAVAIEYWVKNGVLSLDVSFMLIMWVMATFRHIRLSRNMNFGDFLSNANK